jgi:hypothetical protein
MKTTVYLTRDLKRALARTARDRGVSQAALLREAVARITSGDEPPLPTVPLFRGKGASIAKDIDAALRRFGE